MAINWRAIAEQVGDLNADGSERGSGTESGRRALGILIGEENIREAVDHFISLEPCAFTAEMVLKVIRSKIAIAYCFEIYKRNPGTDRACSLFSRSAVSPTEPHFLGWVIFWVLATWLFA